MKVNIDLKKVEKDILEISKRAGKLILKYQKTIDEKGIISKDAAGIASIADLESERFVIRELGKIYPEIPVLSEEQFFKEYNNDALEFEKFKFKGYLWVIDPLDGTNNFVHGLDYFAVCISLVKNGIPVAGVVHAPLRDETFLASKGNSAKFIKNKKSRVLEKTKGRTNLKECLISTGFIKNKNISLQESFEKYGKVMGEVRAIRRMGSAALDLCYTTINIYDGFWERGLSPWDMAAPSIICAEAGVKVTKINGEKHSIFCPNILAARNSIHKKMMNLLAK